MGIDVHGLNCLNYAKQFGRFGKTISLGRQSINLTSKKLGSVFGNDLNWSNERYCENLLMKYYGSDSVDSIDNSSFEDATQIRDLNLLFEDAVAEYDTVLDFGTIEHVFNITNALKNIVTVCKEGGQILHINTRQQFLWPRFLANFTRTLFSVIFKAERI